MGSGDQDGQVEAEVRWSEDQGEHHAVHHHGQQGLALSNLAALAKLEEMERQGIFQFDTFVFLIFNSTTVE